MSGLVELLTPIIAEVIRRDFEEEEVRAVYMGPPLKIFIEDDYVELVKGAEYSIPRWIARILYEKKMVKEYDKPVDEVSLARIYFNETRSRSQFKFEKLQGYFYNIIREQIELLTKTYKELEDKDLSKVSQIIQSIQNLTDSTRNLYRTRLTKILSIITTDVSSDTFADLSEEEKQLYNTLKILLRIFNTKIIGVDIRG
ncbi:MAG: hypothetical protein QXE81_05020 [Desulfurococcaceae archaeon]